MTLRMRGAAATHTGQIRKANEDRAMFSPFIGAVADGMGGHLGGEQAASIVVRSLIEVEHALTKDDLEHVVATANRTVFDESSRPELRGMGTTCVAISLDPSAEHVHIVNVGDSRAYRLVDGELEQVTIDHSLVEELIRDGRLTPDEARKHPQRNIVTRAMGLTEDVDADVFSFDAVSGDRYLLCSDGLFNEVDADFIASVLAHTKDPEAATDELVLAAVEHGGRDNVSAVVVDIVDDDEPAAELMLPPDQVLIGPEPFPITQQIDAVGLRGIGRRSLLIGGLGLATILFLAYFAIGWYGRQTYFAQADATTDEIVIFNGRPDGLLWVDPQVVCETGLISTSLTDESAERLERRLLWDSQGEVEAFIESFAFVDRRPVETACSNGG